MAGMPPRRRLAAFFLIAAVAIAGCGPGGGTTTPGSLTAAPSAPAATDIAVASPIASAGAGQGAQTDTDWGRIWDSLPKAFPRYAGSVGSEEGATGPASATLAVQGTDPQAVATFYQGALSAEQYTTDGLSGPLEDGGYVLDMTGPASGCKVQVTATPTGGLITVTILYGAACPLG
jgi:hypothetical protein